jgi:eukaryotic-like serine/threonine-protein kinase
MTDQYRISRKLPAVSGETTDTHTPVASPVPRGTVQKLRCKLGLLGGSAQHDASEIAPLLRYRLRLATMIWGLVFAIFLVRSFIMSGTPDGPTPVGLALHSFFLAVMLLECGILWTTYTLSIRALRLMELTLFGLGAAFFVYLHFTMLGNGEVLRGVDFEHKSKIASMASMVDNMRWFVLLVLYGTFIPNTWKRCALIVGILAAIPLALNLWSVTSCPFMAPVSGWSPFFDGVVVLSLGAAIAIFGSYKISVLQREAVVARELGQYRLRQKLGSGGMGEVYLAEHVMLRRKCALKLIRPDQTGDPTNLERFEREVQAMAALTHGNTVEVYDYGHTDDGTFYYVMEYLPGLSLQELVDKFGPLSAARAVHFLRQICGALHEAHAVPLIHRDIKPSNVIAAERGGVHDVAKLLDFGLVQCLGMQEDAHKLTVQGVILGSPPYMAPEQSLGRANLDARTDIYSLGAVAYFLLTGQPPFIRETAMELLVAHAHEKPTPLGELRSDVPADVQAIVMRCLEKEPGRRFQDADSLEQALAQCGVADMWTRHAAENWWHESAANSSAQGARMLVG